MKAVAYCRVARHENKNLEEQVEYLRYYANRQKYKLLHIYKDIGSGLNSMELPGLIQLLNDSQYVDFDTVIIKDFDRFSRDSKEAKAILTLLKNNGKNIQVAM